MDLEPHSKTSSQSRYVQADRTNGCHGAYISVARARTLLIAFQIMRGGTRGRSAYVTSIRPLIAKHFSFISSDKKVDANKKLSAKLIQGNSFLYKVQIVLLFIKTNHIYRDCQTIQGICSTLLYLMPFTLHFSLTEISMAASLLLYSSQFLCRYLHSSSRSYVHFPREVLY